MIQSYSTDLTQCSLTRVLSTVHTKIGVTLFFRLHVCEQDIAWLVIN